MERGIELAANLEKIVRQLHVSQVYRENTDKVTSDIEDAVAKYLGNKPEEPKPPKSEIQEAAERGFNS